MSVYVKLNLETDLKMYNYKNVWNIKNPQKHLFPVWPRYAMCQIWWQLLNIFRSDSSKKTNLDKIQNGGKYI